MKNKDKTLMIILLLLLAMAIYYLSKNSQQGREIPPLPPSDPFVENDADILDIDDLVLSDDGFVATTSGCCEGVSYNYDPSCLTDPNYSCIVCRRW